MISRQDISKRGRCVHNEKGLFCAEAVQITKYRTEK